MLCLTLELKWVSPGKKTPKVLEFETKGRKRKSKPKESWHQIKPITTRNSLATQKQPLPGPQRPTPPPPDMWRQKDNNNYLQQKHVLIFTNSIFNFLLINMINSLAVWEKKPDVFRVLRKGRAIQSQTTQIMMTLFERTMSRGSFKKGSPQGSFARAIRRQTTIRWFERTNNV